MIKKLFIVLILSLLPCHAFAADKPVPRVLIALYNSHWESSPRSTLIHQFLEMPANHLGYDIQYADVMAPLPALGNNVAGIIIWFSSGSYVQNAATYLDWLNKAAREGKKIIILENAGISDASLKNPQILGKRNSILAYIGVRDDTSWIDLTYHTGISSIDKKMLGFERQLTSPYPPISGFHTLPESNAESHLRLRLAQDRHADMVITSPNGGFIAPGYAMYGEEKEQQQQTHLWYINPFLFLKESLGNVFFPAPDVTTLDGKRIFYSQIDGDGWNNITEIEKYQGENILSSEIIYREILKSYSDFAFNVALITGDIDPDCFEVPGSVNVAKEIFALPNVEASSHTYSHPLFWKFFEDYTPEKEKPLLKHYLLKPSEQFSAMQMLQKDISDSTWHSTGQKPVSDRKHDTVDHTQSATPTARYGINDTSEAEELKEYNYAPRSYACSTFSLQKEITGSAQTIKSLLPPGKTIRLLQWSGDAEPYEAALAMVARAGLLNINGGDSHFDSEYPSYSFVAPIGLKIGNYRQIYSSDNNEETYTDNWHDRFYGFRYLQSTIKNTESPIRISPFDLYFHMFSGEKQASLTAVKENLNFARTLNIIPITASNYASIANGFYSTDIGHEGDLSWHISNRGDLETVRFDNANRYTVDFRRSVGVLGQTWFQGSLYVALDPTISSAFVHLAALNQISEAHELYLVESRWKVKNLQRQKGTVTFEATGYGTGIMSWNAEAGITYLIDTRKDGKTSEITATSDNKGILSFSVPPLEQNQSAIITIRRQKPA